MLVLHVGALYVCLFNHELYMIEYVHIFPLYKQKGKYIKLYIPKAAEVGAGP